MGPFVFNIVDVKADGPFFLKTGCINMDKK